MDITTLDQFKDEIYGVKVHPDETIWSVSWKHCALAFKSAMPVRRKK